MAGIWTAKYIFYAVFGAVLYGCMQMGGGKTLVCIRSGGGDSVLFIGVFFAHGLRLVRRTADYDFLYSAQYAGGMLYGNHSGDGAVLCIAMVLAAAVVSGGAGNDLFLQWAAGEISAAVWVLCVLPRAFTGVVWSFSYYRQYGRLSLAG